MFISNNRVSFHLWCKENMVKHFKISKYENDCKLTVDKSLGSHMNVLCKFDIVCVSTSLQWCF